MKDVHYGLLFLLGAIRTDIGLVSMMGGRLDDGTWSQDVMLWKLGSPGSKMGVSDVNRNPSTKVRRDSCPRAKAVNVDYQVCISLDLSPTHSAEWRCIYSSGVTVHFLIIGALLPCDCPLHGLTRAWHNKDGYLIAKSGQ